MYNSYVSQDHDDMRQGIPETTMQQIFEDAHSYLGNGSYFQSTSYDTNLFISDSDNYDIYHRFELFNRKILWINQVTQEVGGETQTLMSRTIFKCDKNNFDGHIVAPRLASLLCYITHGTFINPRVTAGTALPTPSTCQPAEKFLGRRCNHEEIDMLITRMDLDNFTEKKWIALAHYRQATLSNTPYYQVLSYWKILELYFNNSSSNINQYIDEKYNSRQDLFHYMGEFSGTAAGTLRIIRHSCAHFKVNGEPTIQDPDNPDIFNEANKAVFVLRRLAESLIDSPTGW